MQQNQEFEHPQITFIVVQCNLLSTSDYVHLKVRLGVISLLILDYNSSGVNPVLDYTTRKGEGCILMKYSFALIFHLLRNLKLNNSTKEALFSCTFATVSHFLKKHFLVASRIIATFFM